MTPDDLISAAEAAGLHLEPKEGGVLHVAPRERLTPALREALKDRKAEILALLRQRAQEAPPVEWSRVKLSELDRVLEVAVPWADVPLILAPGCRLARELRAKDRKPGRVWCVCEALDLLLSGVTPEDARKVAQAKLALAGAVVGSRRLDAGETGR